MKLKPEFITQDIEDTQYLVPVGAGAFSGVLRGNLTAAFIIGCLKEETTRDAILDAMAHKYDAPRDTMGADLDRILNILREIQAIEE